MSTYEILTLIADYSAVAISFVTLVVTIYIGTKK